MLTKSNSDFFIDYISNLQKISQEGQKALLKLTSEVILKKNQDLQSVGHTCTTIYLIKKGAARIYYYKDGNDITECFAFEKNIIARVESLFTGKPSKKAIQALEDSEFVAIQAAPLFQLYDQFPEVERLFRIIFENAYVDTINRIESIQFHSAEERYKALLTDFPDVIHRVALKHIASYLGITQVSLSRIRRRRI